MTDLEVYDPVLPAAPATLIPAQSPTEFLQQAGLIARALVEVVETRKLFTVIGKSKHIHVDAWTSLGSLLGSVGGKSVFAVPDGDPEPIEVDGVKGVKSRMRAVTIDGQIVGGATGYCMRDEPTWRNRPFYALAGMAETRATSRALRKPLGFIVELAGYAATAAEEMPREIPADAPIVDPEGNVFPDQRPFQTPAGAAQTDPNLATGQQLKRIGTLMGDLERQDESGQVTRESLKAEVQLAFGVASSKELTRKEASSVIEGFEKRLETA